MTTSANVSLGLPPASTAAGKGVANIAQGQQTVSGATGQGPAVIITIGSNSVGQQQSPSVSVDPGPIGSLLADISGSNAQIDNFNKVDWADIAARAGTAVALKDKEEFLQGIKADQTSLYDAAGRLGISTQVVGGNSGTNGGSDLGYISLQNFNFTGNGSTYSVVQNPDGTILGTKDGGNWFGHPDSDSGANVALQTLTSLNTKPAATTSGAKAASPLRVQLSV